MARPKKNRVSLTDNDVKSIKSFMKKKKHERLVCEAMGIECARPPCGFARFGLPVATGGGRTYSMVTFLKFFKMR